MFKFLAAVVKLGIAARDGNISPFFHADVCAAFEYTSYAIAVLGVVYPMVLGLFITPISPDMTSNDDKGGTEESVDSELLEGRSVGMMMAVAGGMNDIVVCLMFASISCLFQKFVLTSSLNCFDLPGMALSKGMNSLRRGLSRIRHDGDNETKRKASIMSLRSTQRLGHRRFNNTIPVPAAGSVPLGYRGEYSYWQAPKIVVPWY